MQNYLALWYHLVWSTKNREPLIDESWKYVALTVSSSQVQKVRNYIKNQEIHHQTYTYENELEILQIAIQENK